MLNPESDQMRGAVACRSPRVSTLRPPSSAWRRGSRSHP
jgi:hypothetical protein